MKQYTGKTPETVLGYMLKSLIPYSQPNLKLAFKPSLFFKELSQVEHRRKRAVETAYYRAKRQGLIDFDERGMPCLTDKGWDKLRVFEPRELLSGARLMVIFDIPEHERWKRQRFRRILINYRFTQIQKSVWITKYDYTELLREEIRHSDLFDYVRIYETQRVQ